MQNMPHLNRIATYLSSMFSFSNLFVLFLFSYQYKHSLGFFAQYDPTLIFGLLCLGYLIYFLATKFKEIEFSKITIAFVIFAIWVITAYSWTMPNTYSFAKLTRFLVYVLPSFFMASAILSTDSERFKNFIISFFVFYTLITTIAFFTYFQNPSRLPDLFDTNYLITGQTIGLGTVMLATHLKQTRSKILIMIAILISLFLMLHLGGRGPLLSALVVLFGLAIIQLKDKPKLLFSFTAVGTICIFASFWLVQHFGYKNLPFALKRIFSPDDAIGISLRLEYYQSAWKCFCSHIINGVGLGGWPTYHGLGDIEWHPHNIFLEIASETGAIGLILFTVFLALVIQKAWQQLRHKEMYAAVIVSSTCFCFLNALKSGDIIDNIVFFTFTGLIAGLKNRAQQVRPSNSLY